MKGDAMMYSQCTPESFYGDATSTDNLLKNVAKSGYYRSVPEDDSECSDVAESDSMESSDSENIPGKSRKISNCCIPKSISLPLQEILPDPFPNLTPFTPLVPSGTKVTGSFTPPREFGSPTSPVATRRVSAPNEHPSLRRVYEEGYSRRMSEETTVLTGTHKSKMQNVVKTMLKFYNDNQSYKSVSVERRMQASDVANILVLVNHAKNDANWAIVEHVSKFGLERSLEDHEPVLHTYRSWGHSEDNKFYMRKDFRKYELFENANTTTFPWHMISTKDSKKETKEETQEKQSRPHAQLLKSIVEGDDNCPDIQGQLILREGKKSWKKHFFVLRKSGLYYSTKGSSKDPRHLKLLSTLQDVNIYTCSQAKKMLGAPCNHCIVLKPGYCVSNINELIVLSVEDEQNRSCLLTTMRLVKYGQQLLDNHKVREQLDERLSNPATRGQHHAGTPTTAGSKKVPDIRAAMDFTRGSEGRVITDPTEASQVNTTEGLSWRRRISGASRRTPPGRLSPEHSSSGRRSSPEYAGAGRSSNTSSPSPLHHAGLDVHLAQPWYYGPISREKAVSVITECGLSDGVFLVRASNSIPGTHVLSLAHNHKVKHVQIHRIREVDAAQNITYFTLDGGQTKFHDLIQLIDFHQANTNGLPTVLTDYIPRLV